MVLVDTSVWIRGLAGVPPYATELVRLLHLDEVAAHELVYGELLIGDIGGRRKLLADYELRRQIVRVPHTDVVKLVRHHGLHGRGVSWTDVHLLAAALAERIQLWTADANLAELAREFQVAYKPKP